MGDLKQPESDRLLYGVAKIAEYLGLGERKARHQIDNGRIPTFRMGSMICASPAKLDTWLEKVSGGDTDRRPNTRP